jgi:hypothetical protein
LENALAARETLVLEMVMVKNQKRELSAIEQQH